MRIILFVNGKIGGIFAKLVNKIGGIEIAACVSEQPDLISSIMVKVPVVGFSKGDHYLFLNRYQFDCIISYNWNYRFSSFICEQYEAYNFHPSLLPKHRGPIPLVFSILENDSVTGVTLHRIRKDFDTGEIFGQVEIPLSANATFLSLSKRCLVASINLLKDFVRQYPNAICKQQDNSNASYESLNDLKKYYISNNMSLDQFKRVARAYDNIIPLTCVINGEIIKIKGFSYTPSEINNGSNQCFQLKDSNIYINL